jgi:hypothetical protein
LANCRGCGEELGPQNDSEAHIIPNALGGRLKPKGIICRKCNGILDDRADNALIDAFGDWPTLLDIPRDRGQQPPKLIETRNGRRVRLERDGSLRAVDVLYDVVPTAEGHQIDVGAGDMRTFLQLLMRVKKQFPDFDPKEAEGNARVVGIQDGDELKMGLDLSPKAVFGGVVTAVWLYLILKTSRAFMDWNRLLKAIEAAQSHGGTWRYLIDGLPGLRGPDVPIEHKIIVRSVPHTGELIAYVEILGILKIGGLFAAAGGPVELIEHIYAYDVMNKADRSGEFSIDGAEFDRQVWKKIGLGPTVDDADKLKAYYAEALQKIFVTRYRERFAAT